MFRLSPDHLEALGYVAGLQTITRAIYHAPLEKQRAIWARENADDEYPKTFDVWLAGLGTHLDAIHASAPIFLVSADLKATPMRVTGDVTPRIIVWREFLVFVGGDSFAYWRVPSRTYFLGLLAGGATEWERVAVRIADADRYMGDLRVASAQEIVGGLYWLSTQEAQRHTLTAGQRLGLSRARVRRHRDYYYVAAITHAPQPISEPRGGHHSSPVAHDRRAHQALLSRVDVPRDEIMDLVQRGYFVERTEVTPVEIIERMKLRGKDPVPNTLCAWRWIDRPQMKVNPEGPQSRRVTVVTADASFKDSVG